MKRVSLFFLACIAFALTSSAQVKFGGKAGINLANVSGKEEGDKTDYDSKVGLHIGALVEIPISESFSVMPELNFDQLGAKDEFLGQELKLNLNYISVPVLAKFNVSGLGIYAGPQIGFLLSAKTKAGDNDVDIKDQLKSTNFSALFGAEYNLPMGLFISARYNLGLSKIDDESNSDNYTKANAITFGIGYKFGGSGSAKK
jgi:opacity protein-like surface antigen